MKCKVSELRTFVSNLRNKKLGVHELLTIINLLPDSDSYSVSLKSLAERTGIDRSNVPKTLKKLIDKQIFTRKPSDLAGRWIYLVHPDMLEKKQLPKFIESLTIEESEARINYEEEEVHLKYFLEHGTEEGYVTKEGVEK